MKNLLIVLLSIVALTSCQKEDFGQYHSETVNTYNNPSDDSYYVYSGTLPNSGTATNDLIGTKWVLTKYVTAFATEYPNDTLDFVSANTYTLNGGAVRTYQLSSIPSSTNFNLSLYFFFPFGGSHYTANNIGQTFIQDWQINLAIFSDDQNTTQQNIRAWFTRLN